MNAADTQNPLSPELILAEKSPSRRIEIVNLLLVMAGTMSFFYAGDWRQVWSFLAGGLLNILNLRLLTMIVGGLTGQRKVTRRRLIAQALIKFGGMLGLLAFLMLVVRPDPVPFLLGLSTVVAAIVLEGIMGIFRRES